MYARSLIPLNLWQKRRFLRGNWKLKKASNELAKFLDESIADDVAFSEIKTIAFNILERDKLTQVSQFLNNQSVENTVLEWEFIAAFAPSLRRS
jgi:hypothetical protein